MSAADVLTLLDWKRRVFQLYADVRATGDAELPGDGGATDATSCSATHPQSPAPGHPPLRYFPYDPSLARDSDAPRPRRGAGRGPASDGAAIELPAVRRSGVRRRRRRELSLEAYWLEGYGGGLFLPFRDATSGTETYGGGRYLLDTVKGADLGTDRDALVLDFNFAYNPSCSYAPQWACPLAPPANRLDVEVPAGERHDPA